MRRLLLAVLVVASVAPAAHADPYACVRTRNSKGVPFDVCGPEDENDTERCAVQYASAIEAVPDVSVCSTVL